VVVKTVRYKKQIQSIASAIAIILILLVLSQCQPVEPDIAKSQLPTQSAQQTTPQEQQEPDYETADETQDDTARDPEPEPQSGLATFLQHTVVKDMAVSVIDVGQGSATLIASEGKTLLVDAGKAKKDNAVINYLEHNNIKTIDYLVATHPDADHIGGMAAIYDNFQVNNTIYPIPPNSTKTYKTFIAKAKAEPNSKMGHPKTGGTYKLGDATITVIYDGNDPKYSSKSKSYDTNRASIVLRVVCGKKSILLTGDYPGDMESNLIGNQKKRPIKSDVLQVAHHGSKYSTTTDFIKAVRPSIAIISVGKNSYGHPDAGVLKRLGSISAKIYRTDKNGTIVLLFESSKIKVTIA
jgi:beta-lactamase superfamily II metal-dependent hydrolase